jgi:hypothetical protein
MRALIAALILALASTLIGASPAVAQAPLHLHCLTTPGTTTAIAGGLTANAPDAAFQHFHHQVHLVALSSSGNLTAVPTSPTGSC